MQRPPVGRRQRRRASRARRHRRIEAVRGGRQQADVGVGRDQPLESQHVVRRQRLREARPSRAVGGLHVDVVLACQRRQDADRRARPRRCPTSSPRPRCASGPAARPAPPRRQRGRCRLPADPPRVEDRPQRREDVQPLQEKGALLREEGLERRQVQDDRVGLDLAEVGVDRQVQRQLVRQVRQRVQARPSRPRTSRATARSARRPPGAPACPARRASPRTGAAAAGPPGR